MSDRPWALEVTAASSDALEILVMDVISSGQGQGVGARDVLAQLRRAGAARDITLRINSGGGSVTECLAMMSLLSERIARGATVTARVEGIAASAAALLTTCASRTVMYADSYLMIHSVSSSVRGGATEMESAAALMRRMDAQLSTAFAGASQRRGKSKTEADYAAILATRTDLYLTAQEAVEYGLADEIVGGVRIAASLADISDLTTAPAALRAATYVVTAAHQPQARHQESKRSKMNKAEIQATYPEAFAAIFADGVSAERKRVTGHIKMGESCKAGGLALENIKAGTSVMDEDVFAAYQSEAINRRDISNRHADELTIASIIDGVATGSGVPSTGEDGEDNDLLARAADIFCGPRKKAV